METLVSYIRFLVLSSIVLLSSVSEIGSYRILGVFPLYAPSHHVFFHALFTELADRGHQVVYYSPFVDDGSSTGNYTAVNTYNCLLLTENSMWPTIEVATNWRSSNQLLSLIFHEVPTPRMLTRCSAIRQLLKTTEKFDLLVSEPLTAEVFFALGYKLGIPYMGMFPTITTPWISQRFALPDNPSYIPAVYDGYSSKMNFFERLWNSYSYLLCVVRYHFEDMLPTQATAREVIDPSLPDLDAILKNTSLLLTNTHFSVNPVRPSVPAVIEVGGLHIKPAHQLPQFLALLTASIIPNLNGYRILGVFPLHARSHYIFPHTLFKELANRGHQVVFYSPFVGDESSTPNYKPISTHDCLYTGGYYSGNYYYYWPVWSPSEMRGFGETGGETGGKPLLKVIVEAVASPNSLQDCTVLRELLNTTEKFDLLISEPLTAEAFFALGYKLNIPYIGMFPTITTPWITQRFANPDNPSYIPAVYDGFTSNMNFFERLWNLYSYMTCVTKLHYENIWPSDATVQEVLDPSLPDMDTILKKTSLLLTNTHFSINPVRPPVPAVVDVGGLHIEPANPLPKDIEKFINESTHGVVYFCMGSLLRGESFPVEKRDAFLYAFSKIPQRVLWKWEGDTLPGKSDNIMISKWMPQRDILAHPNVKLFISHGGLLGTSEAVYEGVPIIGIPIFGDQRTNVRAIEAAGAGELLDYNDISKEVVLEKIQRLLTDPKYKENAKELSRRYRDRPMSPLDTAVYWTEYVIRHKGAPHLRSAAVDMPWYQYLLLDVIAFLIVSTIAAIVLFYYAVKLSFKLIFAIYRYTLGSSKPATKKVKSN